MYDNGFGVTEDDAEALKWYGLAAEQGDAFSQFNLGLMLDNDQGAPQNYVRAHMWYNLAAARYSEVEDRDQAVKHRDAVATKMTPAQIAEAQKLAIEWEPQLKE